MLGLVKKKNNNNNTEHFLAYTPAGAESDLNAAADGAKPDGNHRS